jgi:hypothetical protein
MRIACSVIGSVHTEWVVFRNGLSEGDSSLPAVTFTVTVKVDFAQTQPSITLLYDAPV